MASLRMETMHSQEFSDIADYYRPYLMSARLGLGFTDNASCVSMQHKCDDEDAQLLRYVCGRTCCTDPLRSPWYKVPQKGCPAACLADAARGVSGTVCQESNITMNPTWHKFWDHYPQVLSAELGLDLADNFLKFCSCACAGDGECLQDLRLPCFEHFTI